VKVRRMRKEIAKSRAQRAKREGNSKAEGEANAEVGPVVLPKGRVLRLRQARPRQDAVASMRKWEVEDCGG
jgi:hypothetical protein